MPRMISFALVFIALFTLSACSLWSRVETPLAKAPDNSFTVPLPIGWVRADFVKDRIIVTRDGPSLQLIEAQHFAHDKAFPKTEKISSPGLLPSELAELTLAEIRTAEELNGLEVIENMPATVGGHSGFRLVIKFHNSKGLAYQREIVGFANDNGFFQFVYQAPALHYFVRNKVDFDHVVAGVQIN